MKNEYRYKIYCMGYDMKSEIIQHIDKNKDSIDKEVYQNMIKEVCEHTQIDCKIKDIDSKYTYIAFDINCCGHDLPLQMTEIENKELDGKSEEDKEKYIYNLCWKLVKEGIKLS